MLHTGKGWMVGEGGNAVKIGEGKGTGKYLGEHSPLIPHCKIAHPHPAASNRNGGDSSVHRGSPILPTAKQQPPLLASQILRKDGRNFPDAPLTPEAPPRPQKSLSSRPASQTPQYLCPPCRLCQTGQVDKAVCPGAVLNIHFGGQCLYMTHQAPPQM